MARSRSILVSAAVVIVAYVIASAFAGDVPGTKANGVQVVSWVTKHADDIRSYSLMLTIGTAAFIVFLGLVSARLPSPYRQVFLVGGGAFAGQNVVATWFLAGLALHPSTLAPATARTVLDVSLYFGPVLTATTVATIGATAVYAWRGSLPTWFAVIATIAVVEQAIEMFATILGASGFVEPGGAMNFQLGAGLTLVWFAALAWVLSDRPLIELGSPREAAAQ